MASKCVFNLESVHKIGRLAEDFDAALVAAVRDCKERPGLRNPREIKLTVRVIPHPQEPEDCIVHSQVTTKSPARVADAYKMQSTHNHGLKFAPSSPMDPDQGELFEGDDK